MTQHTDAEPKLTFDDPEIAMAWAMNRSPGVRGLTALVSLLVLAAPDPDSEQPYCSGCLWERVLKPAALPIVGWRRGVPDAASQASDLKPITGVTWIRASDLPASLPATEVTTEAEAWLRTEYAWRTLTGWWMDRLDEVDPGNGHGFPIHHTFLNVHMLADAERKDIFK